MLRGLSRGAHGCSGQLRSAWHLVDLQLLTAAAAACPKHAASLATAAVGDSSGTSAADQASAGPTSPRRRSSRSRSTVSPQKGAGQRGQPPKRNQLAWLAGRFKGAARGNDASGAEFYLRAYISAGGEPQGWMLPMLLGTYGRLRQADKAWAIYQRLRQLRQERMHQQADSGCQQGQEGKAERQIRMGQQRGSEQGETGWSGEHQQHGEQQQGQQGQQQQQLLPATQRQQRLADEAARLVSELRLGALPMDQYAYGALLTALSRAEHPPYDLHPSYAAKAAEAFQDMRARGLQPNVVLWHNLINCQAKAGLVDAAFATYRAMRASGARPTSWTFSMLVSACGRIGQASRAADVVDRLMPQAGVEPELPVWNALLGVYGRAGSVDAAYTAWLKMLESGAVPDDCTERVLALAFGSHPALAAEVVAEARQIQQQRRAALGATAAAAAAAGSLAAKAGRASSQHMQSLLQGQAADEQGLEAAEGLGSAAESEAGGSGTTSKRPPYRLHHHRQSPLAVDSSTASPSLLLQMEANSNGSSYSSTGGGREEADRAGGSSGERALQGTAQPAAPAAAGESGGLVGDLLLLDLHGSSQAAARMVLLRRLETLVLQAPQLCAEVDHLEARWHEQQQELRLAEVQQRRRQGGGEHPGWAAPADPQQQSSAAVLPLDDQPSEAGEGIEQPQPAEAAAPAPDAATLRQQTAPAQQQHRLSGSSVAGPFQPPCFRVVTGMGRHSKHDRGGVLKGAVRELLTQQGLPVRDDPTNEGVLLVGWDPLAAYLRRQRRAMNTDRFLTAARIRYLYILSGVAGVAAAAHILPRLAPWLA